MQHTHRSVLGALAVGALLVGCGKKDATEPRTATGMTAASVTTQSGTVGQAVVVPPSVTVVDQHNRGLGGVEVTFAVAGGGGAVTPSVVTTNAQGVATAASWTLGQHAGANTVSATTNAGLAPVTFTATAAAGAATQLAFTTQPATTVVGRTMAPIAVEVRDQFGNVATTSTAGVTVSFGANPGAAALGGTATAQAVNGVATFSTLTVDKLGTGYTLTASSPGLTSATSAGFDMHPPVPSSMTAVTATTQSEFLMAAVTSRPSVRVLDAGGVGVAGVAVSFQVTSGGGSVSGATATSDATGMATVGSWSLGSSAGSNTLRASVNGLAQTVTFTANASAAPASQFNVEVRFVGGTPTAAQQAAFTNAAQRWSRVIVGDQQDIVANIPQASTSQCNANIPALNETIDDIVIYAVVDSIDGPGQILGQAGPCFVRSSNHLPLLGIMNFDKADLAQMETAGILPEVILHEMGHVLGIGTYWNVSSWNFNFLTNAGQSDPFYNGAFGSAGWFTVNGGAYTGFSVPVENTGGAGTRDSHWRESILKNELMTGFIAGPGNPMSRLTIGSLRDIGYTVDMTQGDSYNLVFPGPGGVQGRATLSRPLDLTGDARKPLFEIDAGGRVKKLPALQ